MNENLEKIYNHDYDIWGYPQIYKGIKIYPIKIKDSIYRNLFYRLLTYPKNSLINLPVKELKRIIKMSYLKFILYSDFYPTIEENIEKICSFISYVTKEENVGMKFNGDIRDVDQVKLKIAIGKIDIDEYEFDDIREIILEQNGLSIEYVNEYQSDLEKLLAFSRVETKDIDFEDEIFTFAVHMRKNPEEIGEYTIYQLQNMIERLFTWNTYDLYKPLEVSGQIKLKHGEIKPYLYHRAKTGRYDSILIRQEKFADEHKDIFPGIEKAI